MGQDVSTVLQSGAKSAGQVLLSAASTVPVFFGGSVLVCKNFFRALLKPPEKDYELPSSALGLSREGTIRERERINNFLSNKLIKAGYFNLDSTKSYNFAVAGESGTGKSSLINGIRKMGDREAYSASTGIIETTTEISPYPCPLPFSHIIFWDVPGCNTELFPTDDYFLSQSLHSFDALIIVYSKRLTKSAIDLGRTAKKFERLVVFVRTHSDTDLQNLVDEGRTTDQAAQFLKEQVWKKERVQLNCNGLHECRLFVISCKAFINTTIQSIDEAELLSYVYLTAANKRTPDWEQFYDSGWHPL